MSDRTNQDRSVVRRLRLRDSVDDGLVLDATSAERFEMVWQLTLDAWTFLNPADAKREFQRHVERVERRGR